MMAMESITDGQLVEWLGMGLVGSLIWVFGRVQSKLDELSKSLASLSGTMATLSGTMVIIKSDLSGLMQGIERDLRDILAEHDKRTVRLEAWRENHMKRRSDDDTIEADLE